MPRAAGALSERHDDGVVTPLLDDLIRLGRRQGHLKLTELRTALAQANVSPARARSILRELADGDVRLDDELPARATSAAGSPARHAPGNRAGRRGRAIH